MPNTSAEDSSNSLMKSLCAEALGTMLLVATIVGTGIMSQKLDNTGQAFALFVNAAACASILFVVLTMFIPVSGGHLNPAYTLLEFISGKISFQVLALYIVAQIAGGCAGAVLANVMFGYEPIQVATTVRSSPHLLTSEFVASFGLIGVVLGVAKVAPQTLPAAVGLYIGAAYWFTSSSSFANPAATIGRALSDSWAGIAPQSAVLFIVLQIAGALAAFAIFGWLFKTTRAPTSQNV